MGTGGKGLHPTPRTMTVVTELQRTKNRQGVTMVQLEFHYRLSGIETVWISLSTAIKANYVAA